MRAVADLISMQEDDDRTTMFVFAGTHFARAVDARTGAPVRTHEQERALQESGALRYPPVKINGTMPFDFRALDNCLFERARIKIWESARHTPEGAPRSPAPWCFDNAGAAISVGEFTSQEFYPSLILPPPLRTRESIICIRCSRTDWCGGMSHLTVGSYVGRGGSRWVVQIGVGIEFTCCGGCYGC